VVIPKDYNLIWILNFMKCMCYLYVYIHMYVCQNVCNHQNHQNHCKCKMQMSVILSCKRACFWCVPRNLQSLLITKFHFLKMALLVSGYIFFTRNKRLCLWLWSQPVGEIIISRYFSRKNVTFRQNGIPWQRQSESLLLDSIHQSQNISLVLDSYQ
jgi:hypothetical protein